MKYFLIIFILIPSVVLAQDQATCTANTSKVWDTVLNRCVDKPETTSGRAAIDACMDPALHPTAADKKDCQDKEAQKKAGAAGQTNNKDDVSSTQNNSLSQAVQTAGTIVTAINLMAMGKISSMCSCQKALAVTALAGILTDKLMKKDIDAKLAEINSQYTLASNTTAFNAQKKALEYLQDEQKAIGDIASRESTRQTLLMLGYGTTIVLAAIDVSAGSVTGASSACWTDAASKSVTSLSDGQVTASVAASTLVGGALAGKGNEFTGAAAGGLAALLSLVKGFDKTANNPWSIMAIAGVGFINATMLKGDADTQKQDAERNVATIGTILKTLQDSYVDKCPNGRDDLAVPTCYCNNADGTKNTNRTNSQTCQNLWLSSSNKIIASETNYNLNNPNNANGGVGCVAVNGQFDTNCQCKKLVDPSGNNACMKTTANSITGPTALSQGAFANAGGGTMLSAVNSLTNGGTIPLIDLNAAKGALAKQKVMGAELFKNLLADPANKGALDPFSQSAMSKFQNSIIAPAELAKLASSMGPTNIGSMGGNKPTPALAKAIKQAKKSSNLELSGGQGLNNKKVAKTEPNFNFGDAPSTGAGAVTQNFGEKNYNFKGNDIVKNPDVSIFEIISNRYVESGLKRLFDDK
jgi:hypothetical protein